MSVSKILPHELDPLKCRRDACDNTHDNCEHTQNRGDFYCISCAKKINNYNPGLVNIPKKDERSES